MDKLRDVFQLSADAENLYLMSTLDQGTLLVHSKQTGESERVDLDQPLSLLVDDNYIYWGSTSGLKRSSEDGWRHNCHR